MILLLYFILKYNIFVFHPDALGFVTALPKLWLLTQSVDQKLHQNAPSPFWKWGMSYLRPPRPLFCAVSHDTWQLRAVKTLGPTSAVPTAQSCLTPARILYKGKRHNCALNQHFFYCWGLKASCKEAPYTIEAILMAKWCRNYEYR